MITIKEIKKDIKDLEANAHRDKKLRKKDEARAVFLRNCVLYLETDPSESFVLKEKERVDKLIKTIKQNFSKYSDYTEKTNAQRRAIYYKETGFRKLNNQLKTLEFILR